MLFGDGEEGPVNWPNVLKVLGGTALGLIPGLWVYLQKKRDQAPVIAAKKQRVRAKDESLEQAIYDHRFEWYKGALEGLQARVDKFEADRVAYLSENAKLKERCENQTVKLTEQGTQIAELTDEVDRLRSRVQELEAQAGGV